MIEKSYRHESGLIVFVSSIRIDPYAIWPTIGSPRDLDLRPNFDLDLSMS